MSYPDLQQRCLGERLIVIGTGVIPVPPIATSGTDRLVIEPRTPAVAISVVVIAGPPPANSDGHEAIAEVIVIVDKSIMIVAVPIVCVRNGAAAIPSGGALSGAGRKVRVTRGTAETATAKVPACYVGSTAEVTTAHATAEVASASEASAVCSLRLLYAGGNKKQSARKGGRDKNHTRSHDTSPWVRSKRCPVRRSNLGILSQ